MTKAVNIASVTKLIPATHPVQVAAVKKRISSKSVVDPSYRFRLEVEKDTSILSEDIRLVNDAADEMCIAFDRFINKLADIGRKTENRLMQHPRISKKIAGFSSICSDSKRAISRNRIFPAEFNMENIEQNVRRRLK